MGVYRLFKDVFYKSTFLKILILYFNTGSILNELQSWAAHLIFLDLAFLISMLKMVDCGYSLCSVVSLVVV